MVFLCVVDHIDKWQHSSLLSRCPMRESLDKNSRRSDMRVQVILVEFTVNWSSPFVGHRAGE